MVCENCGNEREQEHRKLCWRCTNWKKRYGTANKDEVAQKKNMRKVKLECALCGMKSVSVVPGAYTSTGKPMHAECSWAADVLKKAIADPVEMYLLKEKLGL